MIKFSNFQFFVIWSKLEASALSAIFSLSGESACLLDNKECFGVVSLVIAQQWLLVLDRHSCKT